MFDSVLKSLTKALCEYGVWASGLFSGHGVFEEMIPEELINLHKDA